MTQLVNKTSILPSATLSVSYKSNLAKEALPGLVSEVVIITDSKFIIRGFNNIAASVYGFTSMAANGKLLFNVLQFEMIGTSMDVAIDDLLKNGYWQGDIIFNHHHKKSVFSTRCNVIKDDAGEISSIVINTHNISKKLSQENKQGITENTYQALVESLAEGVMLINANGTIGAANKKAATLLGLSEDELKGKRLTTPRWKTIREDGSEFPKTDYPALVTLKTGKDFNNVVMGLEYFKNDKKIWITVNTRAVFDNHASLPVAAVVSFVEITAVKEKNERLSESESLFRNFMKDSPTLGWIYDEDGELIYGNPRFIENMGLAAGTLGENVISDTTSEKVLATILKRNKRVLQNGKPIIIEEVLTDRDGSIRYYICYWFELPAKNNKKLIGGHAIEITDKKRAQKEIDKMYERYHFAINASSDAIWDLDIATGFIYLSDSFCTFTGYRKEEITPTLEWLFSKIHPQDKNRIKVNVDYCLNNNVTNWENEYRFQIADGSYRHLSDKAYAHHEDGKLNRVIGAMQDITERKKLEAQLLHEQVQKQRMINQATIKAQEKERNRICGELHDNVNQLLMSAKLHICVAKKKDQHPNELLDKATEYLLMAVEEIRGLSKTLTSAVITNIGLQKSIADIAATMLLLKNIRLHIYISDEVVAKLSPEQQLMVYRIIQEQSNNILKYAETSEALISLKESNQQVELIISDNGKGFDKTEQKASGIGFINIFNRVDAYNGNVELITSPGNGCMLIINFPVTE